MPATLVVGAQWGDEGKGKISDFLGAENDIIARYQGGNNAGHTIIINGRKTVLHMLPAGVLQPGKTSVIGSGCVIDLDNMHEELDLVEKEHKGFRLLISNSAHIILPFHRDIDAHIESLKGKALLGTTKRGIGPAYSDKYSRTGLRMGDLLNEKLLVERIENLLIERGPLLAKLNIRTPSPAQLAQDLLKRAERIMPMITDTGGFLREAHFSGKKILLEGAQGVMLDIELGTYPFVTSSHTGFAGAISGSGLPASAIGEVIGVSKAYCTRVGTGPFPSYIKDQALENRIRELGGEWGATTGRPRKCGWIDLPALRFAIQTNDMSGIALTKMDVLGSLDQIGVCTAYRLDGKLIDSVPANSFDYDRCEQVVEFLPSWGNSMNSKNAEAFISFIEKSLNTPVAILSSGPDRKETINRKRRK